MFVTRPGRCTSLVVPKRQETAYRLWP